MFEFEIYNKRTNEHDFICGYNQKDAFARRTTLNPVEWEVIATEYID